MKENENKVTCSICGDVLDPDNTHEFDGQHYCQDCLDEVNISGRTIKILNTVLHGALI